MIPPDEHKATPHDCITFSKLTLTPGIPYPYPFSQIVEDNSHPLSHFHVSDGAIPMNEIRSTFISCLANHRVCSPS